MVRSTVFSMGCFTLCRLYSRSLGFMRSPLRHCPRYASLSFDLSLLFLLHSLRMNLTFTGLTLSRRYIISSTFYLRHPRTVSRASREKHPKHKLPSVSPTHVHQKLAERGPRSATLITRSLHILPKTSHHSEHLKHERRALRFGLPGPEGMAG